MTSRDDGISADGRLLVLDKISAILGCFSLQRPELTLSEIRQASALPASTCQRLVQNLVREGFLDRNGGGYRIGLRVIRWALPATEGLDIVQVTRGIMQDLRDESGDSSVLYLRDRQYRVVVAVTKAYYQVSRMIAVGTVAPLRELGSAARVFLAYDDDALREAKEDGLVIGGELESQIEATRRQGWSLTSGERQEDAAGMAAPVFDRFGDVAAVIGIAGPASRMNEGEARTRNEVALLRASNAASYALGYEPGVAARSRGQ